LLNILNVVCGLRGLNNQCSELFSLRNVLKKLWAIGMRVPLKKEEEMMII
jgi:hypothetical protein